MTTDLDIQADVDALRSQAADTLSLYREVCGLLFFRYGITPTANKLYQYVRKGSMSAPAEALNRFWAELREKSRVRIQGPDLPESLTQAAGDLLAGLWREAQAGAEAAFAAQREAAQAAVQQAEATQARAEAWATAAETERAQTAQTLADAQHRLGELERDQAAERAGAAARIDHLTSRLAAQSAELERQQQASETALALARRDFAQELEKLRNALERSEARCEAAEKRALLEIDRERQAALRAQRGADAAQHQLQEAETRQRQELIRLQEVQEALREKLGRAEGTAQALAANCQQQADDLQALRSRLQQAEAAEARLHQALAHWQARAEAQEAQCRLLTQTLDAARAPAAPPGDSPI